MSHLPAFPGSSSENGASVTEPARTIPLAGEFDVLVCGGGPAGVAAALAAARAGVKTALIEGHGCLGGIWTAGLLSWIIDWRNKPGIMAEIMAELKRRQALGPAPAAYDAETMKLILEELCVGAGVELRLHTHVVAAVCKKGRRLTAAITESKSGREAWRARVFVDCTGDGDLAAQAGCKWSLGRDHTGACQPLSLMALLTGIRLEAVRQFVAGLSEGDAKNNLLQAISSAGADPSYGAPTIFCIRDDLFALMTNHEYGVSALDAQAITGATISARAEIHKIVDGLRSLGGVWARVRVVATGAQIGVREGRRIHGRYLLTQDDLSRGARFEDAIARATFCVDVHSTDPQQGKSYAQHGVRVKPYDLPLRALIAADVDGLMMAGRCISGDFLAHASYRVTGNAVAMGEAAGVAAAAAVKRGCLPREVPFADVAQGLERLRGAVPGRDRPANSGSEG